ncbi:hypothetical protein ABB31_02860 [Stenotrophomonas pavanii]|nr:hypothetical protein ABB31_02860 [Stenotrophomonas pavanii]
MRWLTREGLGTDSGSFGCNFSGARPMCVQEARRSDRPRRFTCVLQPIQVKLRAVGDVHPQ